MSSGRATQCLAPQQPGCHRVELRLSLILIGHLGSRCHTRCGTYANPCRSLRLRAVLGRCDLPAAAGGGTSSRPELVFCPPGFLASRFLRLRPLANAVLPVVHVPVVRVPAAPSGHPTPRTNTCEVCFSSLLVTALPIAEMPSPASAPRSARQKVVCIIVRLNPDAAAPLYMADAAADAQAVSNVQNIPASCIKLSRIESRGGQTRLANSSRL